MLLTSAWDEHCIVKSLPRKFQTVHNCSTLFVNTVSVFVFGRAASEQTKKSCTSLDGIAAEVSVTVQAIVESTKMLQHLRSRLCTTQALEPYRYPSMLLL